jgi:hypothetical protein
MIGIVTRNIYARSVVKNIRPSTIFEITFVKYIIRKFMIATYVSKNSKNIKS